MEPRRREKPLGRLARSAPATGRALVLGPYPTQRLPRRAAAPDGGGQRSPAARLDEAVGLAGAIDLDVADAGLVALNAIRPATYLGKGKVEETAGIVKTLGIELVVMDCALSPVQQRNLEKAWNTKVLDRTGLILEIFGRRAQTREGSLQVELAHLSYQKSRLVRSWTHLERQRGGFGFLGGPGETQIEADRRMIDERIARIERDLEGVKRTRKLHRENRKRVPYPMVALVGYTNAGKSTLFNRVTQAAVLEADMLFATLDPTLRAVDLPQGTKIILSDTVGFISDLPTMLVAAFRATLEEVVAADVILHVRDVAHEDTQAQAHDVAEVLRQLGVDPNDRRRLIEVWNKVDLLDDEQRVQLANVAERKAADDRPVLVSALTGEGFDDLVRALEARVAADRPLYRVVIEAESGSVINWLYEETEVLDRQGDEEGRAILSVRVPPEKEARFARRCPGAQRIG